MLKYKKVYLEGSGFSDVDFIPCEVCGVQAVDIHHIEPRGMGGTKKPEVFDNLMALCRECHIKYGDKKQYKDFLKQKHMGKFGY